MDCRLGRRVTSFVFQTRKCFARLGVTPPDAQGDGRAAPAPARGPPGTRRLSESCRLTSLSAVCQKRSWFSPLVSKAGTKSGVIRGFGAGAEHGQVPPWLGVELVFCLSCFPWSETSSRPRCGGRGRGTESQICPGGGACIPSSTCVRSGFLFLILRLSVSFLGLGKQSKGSVLKRLPLFHGIRGGGVACPLFPHGKFLQHLYQLGTLYIKHQVKSG